jgi:hypothetical protein
MASVFAGDEIDFLEHAQRSKRDVFEIAYRRSDYEERPGHVIAEENQEPRR